MKSLWGCILSVGAIVLSLVAASVLPAQSPSGAADSGFQPPPAVPFRQSAPLLAEVAPAEAQLPAGQQVQAGQVHPLPPWQAPPAAAALPLGQPLPQPAPSAAPPFAAPQPPLPMAFPAALPPVPHYAAAGGYAPAPQGHGYAPYAAPAQLAQAYGYPNAWATPAAFAPPEPFPAPPVAPIPAGYPDQQGGYGVGCTACGGQGCPYCSGPGGGQHGGGALAGLLSSLLPYSEGGCCAPRWYDITLDSMYMTRDRVSRRVDFSSDGPGPNPDIVLSSDDLQLSDELGFRFNGAIQVFAGASAEFTYYGLFNWAASASDDRGGLFSALSNFGTFPPGGFPQTDNAAFHAIGYSSTIDNFELNFRKRWIGPNCRVQASALAGVRYFYLLEDFKYFTVGTDFDPITPGNQAGHMDYDIRTRNSLTGFQVGGDLWTCVTPGVRFGGEFKAGVFGNYANQRTVIAVTEPDATYVEDINGNDIALISDAQLMVLWRVNPNWTIRVGYFFLYMEGVALAPENFNASAPPNLVFPSLRTSTINDNGSAFYHGGFGGFEWMW